MALNELENVAPAPPTPPRKSVEVPSLYEEPSKKAFDASPARPVLQSIGLNRPAASPKTPATPRSAMCSPRIHDKYGPCFFAFNPGMLDDREHWSMKALQKLCKQAKVDNSGSREEIVQRLRLWHVCKGDTDTPRYRGESANKFALLPVKTVPDKFLGPYQVADTSETPVGRTPLKSCLRKASAYPDMLKAETPKKEADEFHSPCEDEEDMALLAPTPTPVKTPGRTPGMTPAMTPTTTGRKRKASLHFSPYNKVQLISPREGKEEEVAEPEPDTPRFKVQKVNFDAE
jgi:hypothetical protein